MSINSFYFPSPRSSFATINPTIFDLPFDKTTYLSYNVTEISSTELTFFVCLFGASQSFEVTIHPFEVHKSYLCSMLSLLHLDQEDDNLILNNLHSSLGRLKLGSSKI